MFDRLIYTNDAAIRIEESGAGEPGLVFLHYWGGSSRTWRSVINRFGGKPLCNTLDQRGWGASIAADGRYDLSAIAHDRGRYTPTWCRCRGIADIERA